MIDETIQTTFTIEDVQDQLYPESDIRVLWPNSVKDNAECEQIAPLFEPDVFWKWADPWEVTICVHRETLRIEYLLTEHQCLLLKQYIEDHYSIILPPLPQSFNTELWTKKWDLTLKLVNSEPEMALYARLAKTATRSLRTAQKLKMARDARIRHLERAREKYMEAQLSPAKFVCIDIEAYELDHKCTTELGLSIMRFPGGEISSRHLLILEYSHLRNKRFVPDMSMAFGHGTSEWVHLKDCAGYIAQAFDSEDGPVYFIGHDPLADIRYLEKNLKCPFPDWMTVFDTRLMFSAFGGDSVLRKLANCLDDLAIEYWNLHNAGMSVLDGLMAGNDAFYTLSAFLEMCVRKSTVENVEEPSPRFAIRDVTPEDLIDESFPDYPATPVKQSARRVGLDDFLSTPTQNTDCEYPVAPSFVVQEEPRNASQRNTSSHKGPFVPHRNIASHKSAYSETSGKHFPRHKHAPKSKENKPSRFNLIEEEFPPLPPSTPAPMVPASKKTRKPKAKDSDKFVQMPPKSASDRTATDDVCSGGVAKESITLSDNTGKVGTPATHVGNTVITTDGKDGFPVKSIPPAGIAGTGDIPYKSDEIDPASPRVLLGAGLHNLFSSSKIID